MGLVEFFLVLLKPFLLVLKLLIVCLDLLVPLDLAGFVVTDGMITWSTAPVIGANIGIIEETESGIRGRTVVWRHIGGPVRAMRLGLGKINQNTKGYKQKGLQRISWDTSKKRG